MSRGATGVNLYTRLVGISQGPGVVEDLCDLAAVQIHTGTVLTAEGQVRRPDIIGS